MNERIREIYRRSFTDGYFGSSFDPETFAELILTEVISTIYRSDISDKKQERLVDELAYKFGIQK